MKSSLTCVLIFITLAKCQNLDDFQLFSQCDRTVGTGVATCMQHFSPIKFITDFLKSDKESLCCTHFKHTACIAGVKDAVQMAKAANLCPDSFADELVSTLTDSTLNNYIRKSCKSFNTGVCIMGSVGDVVNTIQGFFIPQQQKPVVPQIIQSIQSVPRLFDTNGGNSYSIDDNRRNHNYDTGRISSTGQDIFNPFREIINQRRRVVTTTTTTPIPLFGQSIRDIYNRQYIPEASDLNPTKEAADENQTQPRDPLRSLFGGLLDLAGAATDRNDSLEPEGSESSDSNESSLFSALGSILESGLDNNQNVNNETNGQNFFSDIFGDNSNDTDSHIVKDISDSLN